MLPYNCRCSTKFWKFGSLLADARKATLKYCLYSADFCEFYVNFQIRFRFICIYEIRKTTEWFK